ncbi:expressed unknown protein [Seminavis robusta]|uniref:Uncharacterized protein n=1 Tax=Seminavis robusta TaxID=568900 RepID=A0A9N8ED44_9STRA|nr:expressed unknown protein [Seminavis robusta]|eukprot:Sro1002_g229840.1 n/a (362) ;mRNA; r:12509-13594
MFLYRTAAILALFVAASGITSAFQTPYRYTERATSRRTRSSFTWLHSAPALDDNDDGATIINDKIHPRLPPSYGWTKPSEPKQSLSRSDIQQSHTAKPWILNLVQAAHWSLGIPLLVNSYVFCSQFELWSSAVANHDPTRMLLLILYPMVTFMSALFPIVSHSYDDWQLAPFRDQHASNNDTTSQPLEYPAQDYGNDRLHRFGYNMLFLFLSFSSLMEYHALCGNNNMLLVSIPMCLYGILGDQNHLVSQHIPRRGAHQEPIVPVPVCTTALFAYSQTLWLVALVGLMVSSNVAAGSSSLWLAMGIAVVGQTIGGVYEGVVAESTFSQWDHLISIAIMFTGFSAEAYFFWDYGNHFLAATM